MVANKKNIDLEKIKSEVNRILSQYAEFCFLLGSAGTERFNQESDIDLAIFWKSEILKSNGQEIEWEKKSFLLNELESTFQCDIDLVSLNKIDIIFAMQVLATGRLIFVNDSDKLSSWKLQKLSEYPDFKRSREIIEKNITNRKKYV